MLKTKRFRFLDPGGLRLLLLVSMLFGAVVSAIAATNTDTTLNSIAPNPSTFGQSVTFKATVTVHNASTPITVGTVEFRNATSTGTLLASGTPNASGVVQVSTSSVSAGTYNVVAFYSGSGSGGSAINPSSSGSLSFTVNRANQSITSFTAIGSKTYGDPDVALSAVASSGLSPTFSVSLDQVNWSQSTSVASISGGATLQIVKAGTVYVRASQAGNTNYNAAPDQVQTVQVNNPAPSITSISPNSKNAGDATFTLTVNGSGFSPDSVVKFNGASKTTTFGSKTQLTATITSSDVVSGGTYPITVFNPTPGGGTSNAVNLTVNNPVPTLTAINPTEKNSGDAAFTMTVTGTNFNSSSVVRFNGAARTTTFVNSTTLTAQITAADIASTGNFPITVNNPTPGGGTTSGINLLVKTGTTLDLSSSQSPSNLGQSITLTANVAQNSGSVKPTGTVTFKEGSTVLGTDTLNGGGKAMFTTSSLTAGSHVITAEYAGTSSFGASSDTFTQVVTNSVNTTTTISGPTTSVYGTSVSFTITVTAATGSLAPTGSVNVSVDGGAPQSVTLSGSGTASTGTFSTSTLSAISHSIVASYPTTGAFQSSTSSAASINVSKKTLTGSFTTSNKNYDGNTSAAVNTRSLTGIVGSDAVTLTGGTATFNNKNVGVGKTVSLSGAILSGAAKDNYTLGSVNTATANIDAISIDGAFTASNKTYDGNTTATVSGRSLSGAISGDNVSLSGGTATFDTALAGTSKTVTLTGATLAGTDSGNYTLGTVGTTTANIDKAKLVITFDQPTTPVRYGVARTINLSSSMPNLDGLAVTYSVPAEYASWLSGSTLNIPAGGQISTDAPLVITAKATGNGNYDNADDKARTITLKENKAPVTTAVQSPVQNGNGWNNGNVNVTLSATDATGVGQTYYSVDGGPTQTGTSFPVSAEGTHTIRFWSADTAVVDGDGNLEENTDDAHKLIVRIDKTDPSGTVTAPAFARTDTEGRGWYKTQQTITFHGVDALSGVDGTVNPTYQTIPNGEAATQMLSHSFTDKAGNTAAPTTFEYYFDNVAPTITIAGASQGDNVNTVTGLTVNATDSFLRSDQTSIVLERKATVDGGFSPVTYSPNMTLNQDGIYRLTVHAIDEAGNEADKQITFTVLHTFPDVKITSPDAGMHKDPQTVSFEARDAVMQVLAFSNRVLLSLLMPSINPVANGYTTTDQGRYTINVAATDAAGQTSTATRDFQVDSTPPSATATITGALQNGWYSGAKATVKIAAADPDLHPGVAGSGVASIRYSVAGAQTDAEQTNNGATVCVDITTPGTSTVTYYLEDVAGNQSGPFSIDVQFDNVAPTFTLPTLANPYTADSAGGKTVTWSAITGSDNVGGSDNVQISYTGIPLNDLYQVGTHYVLVTATDDAGNSSQQTLAIIVKQAQPHIDSLSQQSGEYGSADVTLTINGTGFYGTSTVRVNGNDVPTTYVNWNTLSINVPLNKAEDRDISVHNDASTNPGGDAGNSNTETFTVNKKPASVTIDAQEKIYGNADPLLTGTLSGFLPSDGVSATYARSGDEHVGAKPITATLSPSEVLSNYSITTTGADLTIKTRKISIKADDKTKTYGDSDEALTWSYIDGSLGLVGADTLSGSMVRDAGQHVGGYAIKQGTLAATSDYELVFSEGTYTIEVRHIAVTADHQEITYGDAEPTLTYHHDPLFYGDNFTGALSRAGADDAGEYAISQGTLALSTDYVLDFTGNTLKINKATATFNIVGFSGSYDGLQHGATGTATGVKGEPLTSSVDFGATFKNAGDHTAHWSFTGGTNYLDASGDVSVDISKAVASVTPDAKTKVYGATSPTLTGAMDGFVPADGITASYSRESGDTVGVYDISATLSPADALDNYTITYNKAPFSITPKDASVTPGDNSKTYGQADPTLTGTLEGFLPGDGVTAAYSRTAGENANDYTITAELSPASVLSNYTITYNTGTFTIKKAKATITVTPYHVTYDGASHTATGTATGVNSDDLTSLLDLTGTTHTEAGTTTDSWSFAGNGNYEADSDTVSDSIAKASATIAVQGYTGDYDGNAHGATGTAKGVDGNPVGTLNLGASFTNATGGTANWTFDGGNNYENASGSVAIVINKIDATINVSGYTGVYDANAHGATGTAKGVNNEDLQGLLHLGDSFTNAPGGTAHWTFDGDANYNSASGDAAITISKAHANVTVNGYTGTYDASQHGATGSASGVGGIDLSSSLDLGAKFTNAPGGSAHWTFSGGTNYEDQSGDVAITINKAHATVNVTGYSGTYDANQHGATGSANGVGGIDLGSSLDLGATYTDAPGGTAHWTFSGGTNYEDQSGDVAVTINKAHATVTVNGYSGTYDGNEHGATGSATGVGGADLSSSLDLGAKFKNVPGGTAHWVFHGGTNYDDQSGDAAITVNKKSVTGNFTADNKVYDGNTDATVTGRSLTGFVAGDDVTLTGGTATFNNKNVANGKTVTLAGASLAGAAAGNYDLSSVGITTANITRKSITGNFTADNKVYDGTTAATVSGRTLSGIIGPDLVALDGGTATFDNKNVGTGKTVTLTGATLSGADAGNYSLGSVNTTTANVTKKALTIKADDKTMTLNAALPTFSVSYTGFVPGEGASVLSGTLAYTPTTSPTTVGTFDITPSGLSSGNYDITFAKGALTVKFLSNSGILQPVNADGSSVVKQGSTVPCKFQVFDANHASVSAPGTVVSFVQLSSFATTATVITETLDSTTPDTVFRWDASGQQWIFNLSTKTFKTNTKYFFRITLKDGSMIDFCFTTK